VRTKNFNFARDSKRENQTQIVRTRGREGQRALSADAGGANRLALIRAFCASARRSRHLLRCPVQNYFSADTGRHLHIVKYWKTRMNTVRGTPRRALFAEQ